MEGLIVGQYRVTGVIGQGGMGIVYAGEHTLLGRPAAIKVLLPDLSQKQDVVQRFFNEARAATAIRHPGIVEIYDFGWTPEGAAFIVMEHLQGETLGRRASRARFRWQSALVVARQIAGALAAAHAKGIVHRDLKPDNIFLVPDPEVPGGERIKLLDFGIAKLAGDTSPISSVTRTGAVMGTPTYMAPEQCRGVAVDHRADLYALGCIMFELCSGRPPFIGEGTGDVLAAHIHVPVPQLATLATEVPPRVEAVIEHLLAKSPAQRVQSAEQLIQAIDAITTERARTTGDLAGGPPAVPVSAMVTTLSGAANTSRRMPAFGSRRARLITVGSAVGVTVAGLAIMLAMHGRGEDAPRVATSAIVQRADAAPAFAEPLSPSSGAPPPSSAPPQASAPPSSSVESSPPAAAPQVHTEPLPVNQAEPAPVNQAEPAPANQAEPAPAKPPAIARRATAPEPPKPAQARIDATIDSVPSGAEVVVAGAVFGKTPFHGALPSRGGVVAVVVRRAGYVDRTLVAHGGQPLSERVQLVKIAPPRPPRTNRDQSVNPFGD